MDAFKDMYLMLKLGVMEMLHTIGLVEKEAVDDVVRNIDGFGAFVADRDGGRVVSGTAGFGPDGDETPMAESNDVFWQSALETIDENSGSANYMRYAQTIAREAYGFGPERPSFDD